jgi:hypothetical protein
MREVKFYIIVSIFIVLSMAGVINAQWFESQSPSLVNCPEPQGFIDVPDSHLFICTDADPKYKIGANSIIFDKSTFRCRGYIHREGGFNSAALVINKNSGWDIYFHEAQKFGCVHIDEDGKLGPDVWLPRTYEGSSVAIFSVPKRDEIWFLTDKIIHRFTVDDKKWTTFSFPDGWATEYVAFKYNLSEDQNTLFFRSVGTTKEATQMAMIDLITGNGKKILNPYPNDINFLYEIDDIKEWFNHDGFFLFYMLRSLYSYNSKNDEIELLIDGYYSQTQNMIQSADGKYLYLTQFPGSFKVSPDIYRIDLEEKTLSTIEFSLDEGWGFDYHTQPILDREKNWIISCISDNASSNTYKGGYIDLNNYSYHVFSNIVDNPEAFMYIQSGSKFVFIANKTKIQMEDCITEELKSSINIGFNADNWSIMKDTGKPMLLGNSNGTEFCRILPLGRRELHDIGINSSQICSFPNGLYSIMTGKIGKDVFYKEYSFKSGALLDLPLSHALGNSYPDPDHNQIISLGSGYVQYIKPHGIVRYLAPEPGLGYKYLHIIFDPDNDAVWSIYQNAELQKTIVYKLSTNSHQIEKSIEIPNCIIYDVVNSAIDPVNLCLYILDRFNRIGSVNFNTVLKIIDLKKGELVKSIPIQLNHQDKIYNFKVTIPGLIPIPSENKLFIWDHYGSWAIDTSNFNIIYGSVHEDFKAFYMTSDKSKHIDGTWDETRRVVIVVDNTYETTINDNSKRVLQIDLDTGNLVNSINIAEGLSKAFLPDDKSIIMFLNADESSVYTMHLKPSWENPATIKPSTNYIEVGPGESCKFRVRIQNGEKEQNVTAYIWLFTPTGDILFFDGSSFSNEIKGIFKHLEANIDVTEEIFSFKLPVGVPLLTGFYNLNAVFTNEYSQRGPIGASNFYLKN